MCKGVLLMIKLETGVECTVDGNLFNNPPGSGKDRKVVTLLNVRQGGDQGKADVKPANGVPIIEIKGNINSGEFTATLEYGGAVPVEVNRV